MSSQAGSGILNLSVKGLGYAVIVELSDVLGVILGHVELVIQFVKAYSHFKGYRRQNEKNGCEYPDQTRSVACEMPYAKDQSGNAQANKPGANPGRK